MRKDSINFDEKRLIIIYYNINNNCHLIKEQNEENQIKAKVQSRNDIIVSEETYELLKGLVKFETMELLSLEQGKYKVFVMGEFNEPKELFEKYGNSSEWTKQMILRILKGNSSVDKNLIEDLVAKTSI